MSNYISCLRNILWVPLFGLALLANPAMAVDDLGLFELEGNAVQDGTPPPDDWETLHNAGGSSFVFTGINDDPAPSTTFDGGKKDIQDVSQWSGGDGSVPDKNDITNAYAAAYKCPADTTGCSEDDLIVYFGADRVSNNGDAFLGFWFFIDDISFDPVTGDFSGNHTVGDTLVLVNFPQATNAVPDIKVVSWDPTCSKAANNDPEPGQCAAKNLLLVADGAVCGTGPNGGACAITNAVTETAPWAFSSKNADPASPDDFPFESFFEGGINLSEVVGQGCFASFMAETRSSSSFTAALKDFVLDSFPVCAVELSKSCGTGTYNPLTMNLEIPYSVTIKNSGSGTVQTAEATDDDCGIGPGTVLTFDGNGDGFQPGESETESGTCFVPAGQFTPPVINGVSATAEGGTVTVVLAESCTKDEGRQGECLDACDFNLSPTIGVTKACTTALVAEGDPAEIKVKIDFSGTVANTSDQPQCKADNTCVFPIGMPCAPETVADDCSAAPVPLENVALINDNGTPSTDDDVLVTLRDQCVSDVCAISGVACGNDDDCPTPTRLEPGDMAFYSDEYRPSVLNSTSPADANFMDTVTVSGDDVFNGTSVTDMATADCDLCPAEDVCPPMQ